jgi:dTDP-4-dehydrorhamnose reductase
LNTAVFGSSGLLGSDLLQVLEMQSTSAKGFTREDFSISDSVERFSKLVGNAEIIYNCVAYTNVDAAEANQEAAYQVNSLFPEKLAQTANKVGAKLVHFSTDYVFSGEVAVPFLPSDDPNPLNIYGKSKLLGEVKVRDSASNYLVVRTSWLYGQHGECFPKKIIRGLRHGKKLKIVSDQFGCPTWTFDVATHVQELSRHFENSTLHLSSSGCTSWYEFALQIQASIGLQDQVAPIASADLNLPAERPKFSVLDCSKNPSPIGTWDSRWTVAAPKIIASVD